ncbi:unnamed protein product [Camellia sinensis]
MAVAQYEAKFAELSRYAPHQVATKEDRVMLFENGLRSEIYAKVAILEMKTYSALVSKALLPEKGACFYPNIIFVFIPCFFQQFCWSNRL